MTDLNFKQYPGRSNPENPWVGMKMYQLTPWPETCEITYYDIGEFRSVKIGQVVSYHWENGSARYEVVCDISGLECDFECRLLPGSTWEPPPDPIAG